VQQGEAAVAKMTPTVRGEVLVYQRDQHEQVLTVGTTDWYAWLETASSFAFVSETGSFTARRERSGHGRGDWYWRAYRKQQGKLLSRYLGKSETLTQDRLNMVAQALTQPPVTASNTVTPDTEQETALPALHPLLATKLHVPRPRAQLVPRSHLIERLQQGMEHPLTLVSAPAGFGKTTLLAQWLAESAAPAAWLSLEPEDNDPVRFLTYLIAALQMMDARLGTTPLTLLRLSPPPPPETVVTFLANDLMHWVARDVALVLDDYHVITAEPIHRALTYMVEHLPPQLHLILATRADPPLPLARLRARRQLCELRASELRFETAEISAFLQMVMGLDLPAETIAILERRTEGWIVGLQLATLSLRDRADVRRFLAAFSGSHRFVLEYLSEEVFSRQSAPVQSFLLHTCILERLSGPLCDAVTGHEESQAMLERLEHANLFVVSLDDERRWYRYHHLFAEMLKSRLEQTQPTVVAALHQRASTWYEQQDLLAEAVQHALAAPDLERAARLMAHRACSSSCSIHRRL
jgi:LuxR family transcriptional regulator, maltose regulon positive regulatory protein